MIGGRWPLRLRLTHEYLVVAVLGIVTVFVMTAFHLSHLVRVESGRGMAARHEVVLDYASASVSWHLNRWLGELRRMTQVQRLGEVDEFAREYFGESGLEGGVDLLAVSLYGASGELLAQALAPGFERSSIDAAGGGTDAPRMKEIERSARDRVASGAESFVGPVQRTHPGGVQLITLAVPARLPSLETGVWTAQVSLNAMEAGLSSLAEKHRIEIALFDARGQSVSLGEPPAGLPKDAQSPLQALLGAEHGKRSRNPVAFDGPLGQDCLGSGVRVPLFGWAIVAWQLEPRALESLRPFLGVLIGWMFIGLSAAIVGAFYLARRVSRPLRQIARGVNAISNGNFSVKLEVQAGDEIGDVALSINQLAQSFGRIRAASLERVIREKNKTEGIVRSMADALVLIDDERLVSLFNSQFERWFEVPEMQSVGRKYSDVIPHEGLIRHLDEVFDSPDRSVATCSLELPAAENVEARTLHVRSVWVRDGRFDVVGIVIVLRDITREKRVEQMKSDLVSTVSHELRTPLTSIQGFSEILLEEDLEADEVMEFTQIINAEARRLGTLINDFLDLSRIESGEVEMRQDRLSLVDVIQASIAVMEQQAASRAIAIHTEFESTEMLNVIGDRDKLKQIFVNLLSNAVKYSPPERKVEVHASQEADDVVILVSDEGPGIPLGAISRIFDRFFRVDITSTSTSSGTGLGLTIVREIVERHGGTISVESEEGRGATFRVVLPRFGVGGAQ